MDVIADTYWLTIVVSVVLPIVVAVVTKQMASGTVKAVTLLVLAAATGFLTAWQQAGDAFDWKAGLVNTVIAFAIAVASHLGFWKPVSLTGADGSIQKAVPGGVG